MSGSILLVILIVVFLFLMYHSFNQNKATNRKKRQLVERIKKRTFDEI